MILWLVLLLIFILGLFIGSFLNVVIDRVYRGEQFFRGRSYCELCKHTLEPKDLVPVFSYLRLKGKCRYCNGKIPLMLSVVELTTGLAFAGLVYYLANLPGMASFSVQLIPAGIFYFLFLITLLLIFFTDLKYYVIPNIYLYFLARIYLVGGLVYYVSISHGGVLGTIGIQFLSLVSFYVSIKGHLISALVMGLFFAILHFGSNKKAMGEGDIYLSAILALFLGSVLSIVMWFVSFFTGAVTGVALVLVHRKKLKSKIPFGPFLIIGFVVSFLFGSVLFDLYLRLI